jgi:hypothetical protein
MEPALSGALIGFGGSLIVGFIANFCAEDYRRHRDSLALAGALAGELASYRDAWPLLGASLQAMHETSLAGNKITFPKVPKPVDRVFEANVARIGLLGPELSEDLAYVYNQFNAFRELFKTLMDEPELAADQQAARLAACITTLDRAVARGESLPDHLRKLTKRWYFPFRT